MTKNLLKLISIAALISIPKTLSNHTLENHASKITYKTKQEFIQENKYAETKEYIKKINEEIEINQKALDFLKERKNLYSKTFIKYSHELKELKNKKDSAYKVLYKSN